MQHVANWCHARRIHAYRGERVSPAVLVYVRAPDALTTAARSFFFPVFRTITGRGEEDHAPRRQDDQVRLASQPEANGLTKGHRNAMDLAALLCTERRAELWPDQVSADLGFGCQSTA